MSEWQSGSGGGCCCTVIRRGEREPVPEFRILTTRVQYLKCVTPVQYSNICTEVACVRVCVRKITIAACTTAVSNRHVGHGSPQGVPVGRHRPCRCSHCGSIGECSRRDRPICVASRVDCHAPSADRSAHANLSHQTPNTQPTSRRRVEHHPHAGTIVATACLCIENHHQ